MELSDYLLACIDEDERRARAVPTISGTLPPSHWKHSDWIPDEGKVVMGSYQDFAVPTAEHAAHISVWDPARVVAECEVRRNLVRQLSDRPELLTLLSKVFESPEYWRLRHA